MKNKIFLIIPLLILLTGCTVNYDLIIDNNSLKETITGEEFMEILNKSSETVDLAD